MDLLTRLRARASAGGARVLFTEADDERVLAALGELARSGHVRPVLLAPPAQARARAAELRLSLEGVELIDPAQVPELERYRAQLAERRGAPLRVAARLLERPTYLALSLLADGRADGVVVGVSMPTRDVLLACDMMLERAPGAALTSSAFVLEVPGFEGGAPGGLLVAGDCAVNPAPTPEQLAEIAIQLADAARALLGLEPRVALLSFSTHGSADHPDTQRVARATQLARERRPDLLLDGEMQADSALDASAVAHKHADASPVAGRANVLVFPDLDAGNIAYKLVRTLARARAYGVFLQGYAQRVVKLSRGAARDEVVGTALLLAAAGR